MTYIFNSVVSIISMDMDCSGEELMLVNFSPRGKIKDKLIKSVTNPGLKS